MTEFVSGATDEALVDAVPDGRDGDAAVRKAAFECLQEANGPTTIATIADRVVDQQPLKDSLNRDRGEVDHPDAPRHEYVQQVYLALVQRHVPVLEERGVVEYDRENGELALARQDPS